MRAILILLVAMAFLLSPATLASPATSPPALPQGVILKQSAFSVVETMNRLESVVRERGLTVIARVDHAGGAQQAGMQLRLTQLLIFGNPRAGTPLMQTNQLIGLDLPLRVLVWQDAEGRVWLAYNDPAYLGERYGVRDKGETITSIGSTLSMLTDQASRAGR